MSTLNEIYPFIEPRLFPWFYTFLKPDRKLAFFFFYLSFLSHNTVFVFVPAPDKVDHSWK